MSAFDRLAKKQALKEAEKLWDQHKGRVFGKNQASGATGASGVPSGYPQGNPAGYPQGTPPAPYAGGSTMGVPPPPPPPPPAEDEEEEGGYSQAGSSAQAGGKKKLSTAEKLKVKLNEKLQDPAVQEQAQKILKKQAMKHFFK